MANVYIEGIDELQEALRAAGEDFDNYAKDMLKQGAKLCKDKVERSIMKHGHIRNYDLFRSIKISNKLVKDDNGDVRTATVAPAGVNKAGVKLSYIGFVLNYGRSDMDGSRFWTEAEEQTRKEYDTMLEEKYNLFLKEKGLK